MRGFYAMPLNDDTGRVGVLAIESAIPISRAAHMEIIKVLAGQATVALRNAQMYKEVPFISVLEPMLDRKRKFMAMEKRRRALFLISGSGGRHFPGNLLPSHASGWGRCGSAGSDALKCSRKSRAWSVRYSFAKVNPWSRGQVLAEMDAWDYRVGFRRRPGRYQATLLRMNHSLGGNDGGEAGIQRVQADYWKAAVDRAKELLDRAQLRSPINGVVATPHVENLWGVGCNLATVSQKSWTRRAPSWMSPSMTWKPISCRWVPKPASS